MMTDEQEAISNEENDEGIQDSSDSEERTSNEESESFLQSRDVIEECASPDVVSIKVINQQEIRNSKPNSDDVSEIDECEMADVQTVQVDQATLHAFLDRAVNATSKATVTTLEGLYSQLSQSIYRHRMELEKSGLIRDMDDCICQFLSGETQ